MNNTLKKIFSTIIVISLVAALTGCSDDKKDEKTPSGANNTQASVSQTDDEWGLTINGKSIVVPCKLTDLEDAGVTFLEDDMEEILSTPNKEFGALKAFCSEKTNKFLVSLVTGDDLDAGKDNATVIVISNNQLSDPDLFSLKNKITCESNIEDVLATFGDDCEIMAQVEDDYQTGIVILMYETGNDSAVFKSKNGSVFTFEVRGSLGE